MLNEKLEKCAEILGVRQDSLAEFPEDIQNKLVSCMEIYDVSNADDARQQYEEMERIWRTGTLILGMIEISENTGIPHEKLKNLTPILFYSTFCVICSREAIAPPNVIHILTELSSYLN